DVSLAGRRISIHSGFGRLKTHSADRDVPISEDLAAILAEHAANYPSQPEWPVFPGDLGTYHKARDSWQRICQVAGITQCRIHDLRHTFGVHASRGGVPLVRIQRLLGHTTASVTMRYMRHAPDADFLADAAVITRSMSDVQPNEEHARAALRRARLVPA